MSLAWGQAAETWTLLIWPCVEKPSHHKHLMLQVLCWSSEAYWNSWKNCRWRRWVTDEAGETYAVLDVYSSPAGSKPALCGCKWNIVPTPRSLYKESFSTWQQTGDDDWVLIFFFSEKCSAGSGWARGWDSMVEIAVSCVKLSWHELRA